MYLYIFFYLYLIFVYDRTKKTHICNNEYSLVKFHLTTPIRGPCIAMSSWIAWL